jgi:hypothetical protein
MVEYLLNATTWQLWLAFAGILVMAEFLVPGLFLAGGAAG